MKQIPDVVLKLLDREINSYTHKAAKCRAKIRQRPEHHRQLEADAKRAELRVAEIEEAKDALARHLQRALAGGAE